MAIDQTDKIDFIGLNDGVCIMTISDHLTWEEDETGFHLELLQEKLNTYISFYESGEIYESYPKSKGRNIEIKVVAKYPLPDLGKDFIDSVSKILDGIGIRLSFNQLE